MISRGNVRTYLTLVFHPARLLGLAKDADQAASLAELHLHLRLQAETALAEERKRNK